jgi:hypothetical protein
MMRKRARKAVVNVLIVIILSGIYILGYLYHKINSGFFNIKEPVYICIDEKKDYLALLSGLESVAHIKDRVLFESLASKIN